MKKIKQKLMLVLTTFTFIFSSCYKGDTPSSSSTNSSTNNSTKQSSVTYDDINFENSIPQINVKKEKFDPIEIGSNNDPKTDIDVNQIGNNKTSTYSNVDPNYKVKILSKGTFLSSSTIANDLVTIEDQGGRNITPKITDGNDSSSFYISAIDGYEKGECYTISLKDNSPLIFDGKDETIRSISFTVRKDNTNNFKYKGEIKHLSSSLIISIDDLNTDDMKMMVSSSLNAKKDDIICFDYENEDDNIYIKFISEETYNLDKYKVHYTNPSVDEVFDELELHQDQEGIDMQNNFHLNDEKLIRQSILESEFTKEYAAAVAYTYNFQGGWIDFWKSAIINISFFVDSLNLNFQIDVKFVHKSDDGYILIATMTFEYKRALEISADVKIKRLAGILPYATMNCSGVADDVISVKLQIMMFKTSWDPSKYKPIEEDPEKLNWDAAKDAVSDMNQNIGLDEERQSEALGTNVTGPTLSVSLGYISMQLGSLPLSLDIEVFFCATVSITAGLCVGYTWNQRQVFLQYSNSNKKESKGSSSPEITKASTANADFFGKLYVEISIKLYISLYITGTKNLVRLSISLDGGVYLSVSGFAGVTYDFINNTINGEAGGTITFGLFIRITLSVVLFNLHSFDYNLYDKKFPLVSLGNSDRLLSIASDKKINLSKKETNIDDTDALSFKIFDGNSFKTTIKTFKYNSKRTLVSGLLISKEIKEDYFTSIAVEGNYLKFENGKFIVNDSAPRGFETNLIVTIKSLSSLPDWKVTIPISYIEEGAHKVTFDGDTTTATIYALNDVIKFPIPKEKDGYRFVGYSIDNGKTIIDMNEKFLMPDYDLNITSIYVENKTFTVTYYDGFGNKVGEEKVLNQTSAKGIDPELRDKNMKGYIFLNWDVDLSSITSDIDAYGIYIQVGAN